MSTVYLRNARVGNEAMLLPWQGGYAFYHANRPGVTGRYFKQDRFSLSDSGNPTHSLMIDGYQAAVDRKETAPPKDNGFYHAVNRYWFDKTKTLLRADLPWWLGHMARKGFYLVSAGQWTRMLACLVGFITARVIVMRTSNPIPQAAVSSQQGSKHASQS